MPLARQNTRMNRERGFAHKQRHEALESLKLQHFRLKHKARIAKESNTTSSLTGPFHAVCSKRECEEREKKKKVQF